MSDRDKFAKHEKADLIKFCRLNGINSGHCFAKIDFVNAIVDKGYVYTDFNLKKKKTKKESPQTVSSKGATNKLLSMPPIPPRARLKKTATRFCVDADIDEKGELDVAEFILAAKYLGSEVNNDELMDVFMEHMEDSVETNEKDGNNAKQAIKDLMKKVEDKYGKYDADDDDDGMITSQNTSVYTDVYAANTDQSTENEMDDFLYKQQKEQQLEIARNLLQITALTRQEIAAMTGVDPNDLKQYESDDYDTESDSDYETESDDLDHDDEDQNEEKEVDIFDGIKIVGGKGKQILIEKKYCDKLQEIITGGMAEIESRSEECVYLLQILSDAINLAPGAMKRAKTMAKLNLHPVQEQEQQQEQKTFPAQFRVVISPGALCKSDKDLNAATSTIVARLYEGTAVTVEEIEGNRARISSPNDGWCSLVSTKNGAVIIERIDNKSKQSKEMAQAVKKDKLRKTQVEIVKNVTTLNEVTVVKILEKSDWNMRIALDSFFIAKFKTQEYEKNQQQKRSVTTSEMFKDIGNDDKKKKGWFKSWKAFANDKKIDAN